MNKVCIVLLSAFFYGCQHVPSPQPANESFLPEYRVMAPISLYGTYPSETLQRMCHQAHVNGAACVEDALSGNLFVTTLQQRGWFENVFPASSEADYELLIASLGTAPSSEDKQTTHPEPLNGIASTRYFTELTIQWRGVEIDSAIFTSTEAHNKDKPAIVNDVLEHWWLQVVAKEVFSAAYLFEKLGASNYLSEMSVPEYIDNFTRLDTQLYPDPFKGVITRYVHPEYDDALLDVTVAPVLNLNTGSKAVRLQQALQMNLNEARQMAEAQSMTLYIDEPVAAFDTPGSDGSVYEGYRMAVHAILAEAEPIYATTYAFEMKDKVVTISTTFPPRVADRLVALALPQITVPGPSPLMESIRRIQAEADNP